MSICGTHPYLKTFSSKALVNLLLTGNAAPYLHNGVVRVDSKGKPLHQPLNGIRGRSEVGFLFFDKKEHANRRTEVKLELKLRVILTTRAATFFSV